MKQMNTRRYGEVTTLGDLRQIVSDNEEQDDSNKILDMDGIDHTITIERDA